MTSTQIKTILSDYGFSKDTEIRTDVINKIITDLENPIFPDMNTRLYFRTLTGGGILEIYYKDSEEKPDFIIPFSAIYGFEFNMNKR